MSELKQASMLEKEKILPAIMTFIVLTALLGGISSTIIIEMGIKRFYMALMMWSPGIAAFLTLKIYKKDMSSLGLGSIGRKYLLPSYLLPFVYGMVAYAIIWQAGYGGFGNEGFYQELAYITGSSGWSETRLLITGFILLGTVGLLWHITTAIGEEIGWRGFLVLQLYRKVSFFWTSVISGLVWAMWHMPLILYADYNAGPEGLYMQAFNFTLLCVAMSFPLAYYRIKSGSVWPAALMHAAHNVFILSYLHPLTIKGDYSFRYIGEFGIILPTTVLFFAAFYWYKASRDGINGPIM